MKIEIYGEEIECDNALRSIDSISIYLDGKKIREDNGIDNFYGYTLKDENRNVIKIPFVVSNTDRIAALEEAILTLALGGTFDV